LEGRPRRRRTRHRIRWAAAGHLRRRVLENRLEVQVQSRRFSGHLMDNGSDWALAEPPVSRKPGAHSEDQRAGAWTRRMDGAFIGRTFWLGWYFRWRSLAGAGGRPGLRPSRRPEPCARCCPCVQGFVQAAGEHTQSWVLVADRSPGLTPERVPAFAGRLRSPTLLKKKTAGADYTQAFGCYRPRISQSGRAATARRVEAAVQAITRQILDHGWNTD